VVMSVVMMVVMMVIAGIMSIYQPPAPDRPNCHSGYNND